MECDGERWHGLEQYHDDMARQRKLERCDWTFWRVRGGTFYRDPDIALEGLWKKLNRLEIHASVKDAEKSHPATISEEGETHRVQETNHVKIEVSQQGDRSLTTHTPETAGGIEESTTVDHVEVGSVPDFAKPYRRWTPRRLPDPRFAPPRDVVPPLVEIINAEGPIICRRAYQIYARAVGIRRVGGHIRSILNRAVRKALREGLVEQRDELAGRDKMKQILRKAGTPAVFIRTRGDREFSDIPPAEIGAIMKCFLSRDPNLGEDELLQSVLDAYEVKRMTLNIRNMLLRIKDRYVNQLFEEPGA